MKTQLLLLSLFIALLNGCATPQPVGNAEPSQASWISPEEAVMQAAEAAPYGVKGTFALEVQGTGERGGVTYLNSELDYRDQRNLTVAIAPGAANQLAERLGQPPSDGLMGEEILVRGTAKRVRIDFLANGRVSGKYYYQTHVEVTEPDQITLR